MAEDIEKTQREQAVKIQAEAGWDCHREEHEGITDENIKEHVEECLEEMLYSYSEDKRNYVLDGAVISCSQMSDKIVAIQFTENGSKISIEGSGKPVTSTYKKPVDMGPEGYDYGSLEHIIPSHVGEKNIRKLHAAFGNGQSDNGIRFATVIDRSYLREKEEGAKLKTDTTSNAVKAIGAGMKSAYEAAKENLVSIVSCGNCKKLEEGDIKKIAENWEGVRKYGTCYALIQPASRWINPYCMESVTEGCESTANSVSDGVYCTVEEHHKPMKFSTLKGEKEGLTMMSTLLCGKEGIITIEASGQIYVEPMEESIDIEIVQGVSEELIKLLKSYETGADAKGDLLMIGEPALQTYHGKSDSPGVNTIGWGHAMSDEEAGCITFANGITKKLYNVGSTITYVEAEELLDRDIAAREKTINQQLEDSGIAEKVNQQFYDALFLLYFQNYGIFTHEDFSGFLDRGNFDVVNNGEEIMLQFGEYISHGNEGTMKRRADELDIIFYGDYERDYDENRYGDIWGKLTEQKQGK